MEFISQLPTLTLLLMAIILLMAAWFAGPGYSAVSVNHSPTILTSTGIFGTFLGVALGLLNFDTSDIQASVPALIDGLKTAFWTSIAGLAGALGVKFRHLTSVVRQSKVTEQYKAATVTDLANLLGSINDSLGDVRSDGLRREIQDLRKEQQQQSEQLREELGNYQVSMTEANTQALIGALETVMKDFNTQINTQYGENFKELNVAVGKMLVWQENYKVELEALLATQRTNGDLLDKASGAYEKLVQHSEIFSTVSESLGTMLDALQLQSEGLDAYLTQLATVAGKASEGLPKLEGRVDALTTQLATSVNENQKQVTEFMTRSATDLQTTSLAINTTLAETLEGAQRGLHERVEKMIERTEQQVSRLDDAMEDELTKALTTFGYQLSSLSEKFVQDYTPLTERLKELVHVLENERAEL